MNVAGSPVDIAGVALNKTAITSSSACSPLVILDIQEPTTTISDLRVHHSTSTSLVTGIRLAGDADNILVTNQSAMGQFDGIAMVGTSASLDSSGVDLVYPNNLQNRAVFVAGGADAIIRDSSLRGVVGVFAVGDGTLQRARIQATQGVVASCGSTVQVSDSSIAVPGPLDMIFQAAALVARGAPGSPGRRARGRRRHARGSGSGGEAASLGNSSNRGDAKHPRRW